MGYRPIAVCSPHNFDLVRSYGAEATIDYHDGEKASAEIKRISGGGVELGLDTISEGESYKISIAGFGEKGGQLNLILPPPKEAHDIRPDVKLVSTIMYTLFGRVGLSLSYGTCSADEEVGVQDWDQYLPAKQRRSRFRSRDQPADTGTYPEVWDPVKSC